MVNPWLPFLIAVLSSLLLSSLDSTLAFLLPLPLGKKLDPMTFSGCGCSFSPSFWESALPARALSPARSLPRTGWGVSSRARPRTGSVKLGATDSPGPLPLSWLASAPKKIPLPLTLLPWLGLPEVQHPVKITYAQYEKYLKADNMIRTTAVCQAADEAEVVVARDIILDNPTLTLEVRGGERVPPLPANPKSHSPPRPPGRSFPGEGAKAWGPASAKWNRRPRSDQYPCPEG